MAPPSRTQLLTTVQAFLGGGISRDRVRPELNEFDEIYKHVAQDLGLPTVWRITSMRIVQFDAAEATVEIMGRRLHEDHQLLVYAVYDGRWRIADLGFDGGRLSSRLQPIVVEPAEAEGIKIRAIGLVEPSGERTVAVTLRNSDRRPWRLRCAGTDGRWGPLRMFAQIGRSRLRRAGAVDYAPGTEHGFAVRVPIDARRLWIKVRPERGLHELLFALSWDGRAAVVERPRRFPLRAALATTGLAVVAVLIGLTKGPFLGVGLFLLAPFNLISTDICVRRLERRLARLRSAG